MVEIKSFSYIFGTLLIYIYICFYALIRADSYDPTGIKEAKQMNPDKGKLLNEQ